MYKVLVRSHLDYYDRIYHIPSALTDLMEKAERIQYQAAYADTGVRQGSSRSKFLSERRWCRRILQIHKIVCFLSTLIFTNK